MLACHCGNKDLVQLYLDYSAEVDKCAEVYYQEVMCDYDIVFFNFHRKGGLL